MSSSLTRSTSGPATPHSREPDRLGQRLRERHLGEPAVGQAAQVVQDGVGRVALLDVEVDAGLGVLALGELALAARDLLHQRRDVRVGGRLEAERLEQLQVQRHDEIHSSARMTRLTRIRWSSTACAKW